MKQPRHGIRALLFAVFLLISLVAPSGIASATSAYDSVIDPVGSVHLSRDGATQGSPACAALDITTSWTSILTSPSSWTSRTQIIGGATQSATLADWATTLENGTGWAVVQQHYNNISSPDNGSPIGDAVNVVFSPSESAQVDFSSNPIYFGAQKQAYMTNTDDGYIYFVRIQFDDLGPAGGNNMCTPVISTVLREPSSTPSYWENESVAATSTESSHGYSLRPLFVNALVNYPSGYEGEVVTGEAPKANYVAMGESYSSGEGNPPFEGGTDTGANTCHRSTQAYPRLVQSDLALGLTAFVACSGAVSDYIINNYNQENVELPQAVYVSENTSLVTISIGGNDMGFSDTIAACVASNTAQGCLDAVATASDNVSDPDFLSDIEDVLSGIRSLGGTDTQVIAIGYPQLFPAHGDISGSCTWGTSAEHIAAPSQVSGRTITEDEIDALREVHDDLNDVIAAAVMGTSDSHVHFVDPTVVFGGHEVCGALSDWVNGISLTVSTADISAGSFHPNGDGQAAYAGLVEDEVESFS